MSTPKVHADVRSAYDAWAPHYESDGNPLVALDDDVAPALWQLDRGSGDPRHVLDLGCGTGRHTRTLVERGARVVGVDVSAGMLERARAALPEVRFERIEPGAPLPFADASFDVVSCTLVLEHVEHLAPVMREIARVLRSGGRAVVTDIHPAMRARTQANFTDPTTGHDVLPPSYPHHAREYLDAARAAGLRVTHHAEHFGTDALVSKTERARKYLGEPMLLAFAFERPGGSAA